MNEQSNSPESAAKPAEAALAPSDGKTNWWRVVYSVRKWWRRDVIGTVDQAEVIEKRRADCELSERYLFMTAMSGGIAILGLLLSSPAVVIGAMLLSPLMGPIMGLGFALAIGDYQWLKQSARSLAWGSILAIVLCALVVYISPIQTITPEIAARTRPNLFDLFVALFSGMAGAYAMIRGQAGTIVGVAIATALMPPLAVVGFGLAAFNWTVFSGALLLYVTNLITIALTAWAMARLFGFRTTLSKKQTQFQNFIVVAVFIGLAVPLTFSLQQIAWEARAQGIVRAEIEERFDQNSILAELEIDFGTEPVAISAQVLTPNVLENAEADIEGALARSLARPVELSLGQSRVPTGASAAQQAQLSAARANEEAAALERAEDLATRLALVAGVSEDDVVIDRTRRRALVRAQPLDGASLEAYRTLENRIAATEPEWTIELLPPVAALPDDIRFEEDGPSPAGARALSVVEWASRRTDLPIVLVGSVEQAEAAAQILRSSGTEVRIEPGIGPLRAEWGAVDE